MQNPSCLLYGPGIARFEDRPIPSIEDPHDVIIRIAYVGVCGSDVHFWTHGGVKKFVSQDNPLVMGHEASGIVHAVGPAVSALKPGDPVAIEPGFPCRRCSHCKMGKYNLCPHMQFAASPPTHGTLCKYFRIPDDCCYKINTSAGAGGEEGGGGGRAIGLDEAALIEPLAVAVHSVRQGGVQPGDKVVVFGAGTVGLLCAAVAREYGAAVVTSVDIRRDKLDAAEAFVPDADGRVSFGTVVPDASLSAEENAEILCRMIHRDDGLVKHGLESDAGYDVAIEATGAEACIQMGVYALRVGGSFVQTGLGNRVVGFPVSTVAGNEICVKGCFRYGPGDFGLALELVLNGRIGLKKLITKVVSFEEVVEAWETTRRGEGIKTLIRGVGFPDDAGEV